MLSRLLRMLNAVPKKKDRDWLPLKLKLKLIGWLLKRNYVWKLKRPNVSV